MYADIKALIQGLALGILALFIMLFGYLIAMDKARDQCEAQIDHMMAIWQDSTIKYRERVDSLEVIFNGDTIISVDTVPTIER